MPKLNEAGPGWLSSEPSDHLALLLTQIECVQGIRHQIRGYLDDLAVTAALLKTSLPKSIQSNERTRILFKRLDETIVNVFALTDDLKPPPRMPLQEIRQADLREIVETGTSMLKLRAQSDGVELRCNGSIEVLCDFDQMRVVFTSLLMEILNALRRNPASGTKTVETAITSRGTVAIVEIRYGHADIAWESTSRAVPHGDSDSNSVKATSDAAFSLKFARKLVSRFDGSIELATDASGHCIRIALPSQGGGE